MTLFSKKVIYVSTFTLVIVLGAVLYFTTANAGFMASCKESGYFILLNKNDLNYSLQKCPYQAYLENKHLRINLRSACESASIEIYNKQNILIFQSDKKVQKEIVINTIHWEKNEYRIDIINDFKTYTGTFNVD